MSNNVSNLTADWIKLLILGKESTEDEIEKLLERTNNCVSTDIVPIATFEALCEVMVDQSQQLLRENNRKKYLCMNGLSRLSVNQRLNIYERKLILETLWEISESKYLFYDILKSKLLELSSLFLENYLNNSYQYVIILQVLVILFNKK